MKYLFRSPTSLAAPLVTLIGATLPWVRLVIRGHVEFCQGSCNPPDWFDHAETLGLWLSLSIPILALWFVIQRQALGHPFKWASVVAWMSIFICVLASALILDYYHEAYLDARAVWRPFKFL